MSSVKEVKKHRELAFKLINSCRGFVETNNIIGFIGFYLALHKQGKLHAIYNNEDFSNYQLYFGQSKPLCIYDICRNRSAINHSTHIVNQILYINDSECSLAEIFEEVISIVSVGMGHTAEFIQPKELTEFVTKLQGNLSGKLVYNPCAGIASYQLANPNAHFVSQDINENAWIIGSIRLFLHGLDVSEFYLEDCMELWGRNVENYDYVISTPPFGMPLRAVGMYPSYGFSHRTMEGYVTDKALNSINYCGAALIVVSPKFLFDKSELEFKKFLIHNGYIHSIVLLPPNLFSSTSIQTAIIKISKIYTDKVVMIDGSSFYTKERNRNILNTNTLFTAIESKASKYVQEISSNEIIDKDYNLSPSLYVNYPSEIIDIPDGYVLCKLSELVSFYNGGRCKKEQAILVKGQDLANNRFDFEKTFQDLSIEKLNKNNSVLDRNLLLILRVGNLKPTFFKYSQGIDICSNPNILSFEINQNLVEPLYLVNELSKEYVSKQIAARTVGAAIPSISKQDILEIEILIPALEKQSIEVQRAMYENEKYNYSLAKVKELGLEALLEKQRTDFIEEIRIKKHCLRQYLADITSSVSALTKYVNKQGLGENLLSDVLNISLSEYLSRLATTVDGMDSKLDLLTQTKSFGNPEKVDLIKMLRKIKSTKDYKVEHIFHTYKGADGYFVSINESDFNEVLQNIISNAVMHGFTNGRIGNVIRIDLSFDYEDKMHVIKISNNGKPMPKGMDSKRYGIKGEIAGNTGHEGIGGYRVKSIVEHFKGRYSVENDNNSIFPVQITIKLPKID